MASTGETPFVRVEAVSKIFDGHTAVSGFNLDIRRGEFVSLLGPSGCGKTTLLRIIAGLEFPDAGRILLDGKDITATPSHKRPVNMVFQRVTLFPHLNVFDNIAFGLRLRHVAKAETQARVADVLKLVRLPGFEERRVQTLSGGQAQRVALARAIVNQPKVLLFDEPLSALDLQIRRELQVELKDIHRELGGTFVYVTHDQEEAMSMSDRVVVMRDGEIIQVGTPVELYRSPSSLFVAAFVGSPNVWHGDLVETDGRRALVAVGERMVPAPVSDDVRPGDRVAIVLRPETMTLVKGWIPSSEDDRISVEGTVGAVRFVGAVVDYRIELGDRTLNITRPSTETEVLQEGDPVTASWRPEDTLLLKAEAAGRVEPAADDRVDPERGK